jgi:hypothetical protein
MTLLKAPLLRKERVEVESYAALKPSALIYTED